MKFLRLISGTCINFEHVSKVDYTEKGARKGYFSHIYLKDGSCHDFMEIPLYIDIEPAGEYTIEGPDIAILHEICLDLILGWPENQVIPMEKIEEDAWELLSRRITAIRG